MYNRQEHDESKPLTCSVAVKREFIVIPRTGCSSTPNFTPIGATSRQSERKTSKSPE